ncbi:P-loop containing nucleoside triphosphate hydrolase protein [Geranomyces variabilis]|nr:P-loop containing nucleoside triphosphate hydrolase protein [Geranomyces variabilis]
MQTEGRQPSPELKVSWLSRLTFTWIDALLVQGEKKALEDPDVWDLISSDKAEAAVNIFEHTKGAGKTFAWRLFEVRRGGLLTAALYQTCYSILGYRGPFFMFLILKHLQEPEKYPYLGWLSLVGLFVTSCVGAALQAAFQVYCTRVAMSARSILVDQIYQKSLQRAAGVGKSCEETTEKKTIFHRSDEVKASFGQIITLMSSDVNAVRDVIQEGPNDIVGLPIDIGLGIAGLVSLLGWQSGLIGLGVLAFTGPAISVVYKAAYAQILASRVATDARTTLTNEAIQNIRVLKFFGWEDSWAERIIDKRKEELRRVFQYSMTWIGMEILRWLGTMGVVFVTLLWHTLVLGETLTPAKAFTAIALLNIVGRTINFLPAVAMWLLRGHVAFSRINAFLNEDDLERYSETSSDNYFTRDGKRDERLGASSCRFQLRLKREAWLFRLRNVNIDFPIGKLSAIVGPTGSGKSSLLLALLGEMRRASGQISLSDPRSKNVAYAAQSPWCMNASVKENILFGAEFDAERYERVLDACALRPDLGVIPGGENAEIGEKGINLSGGQKARISLARALYSPAEIILCDDPLSAVDATTARTLLRECFLGDLMRNRTIIIVTHAVDLVLPEAAFVVCMRDGAVAGAGTLEEVLADPALQVSIEQESFEAAAAGTSDAAPAVGKSVAPAVSSPLSDADTSSGAAKLTTVEEMSRGKVDRATYLKYFASAGGMWVFCAFIFGVILTQASSYGSDWWVKRWTESVGNAEQAVSTLSQAGNSCVSPSLFVAAGFVGSGKLVPGGHCGATATAVSALDQTQAERDRTLYFLGIYALFNLAVLVVDVGTYCLRVVCAQRASAEMHTDLLTAVLRSPMRWFEQIPSGRIIARFSKDLGTIDGPLIQVLHMFLQAIFLITCTLIVIGWVVPISLFAIPAIILIYGRVGLLYVSNSRELKRLDSVTSSPIYSLFSETLQGVTTIRAYGAESRLIQRMRDLLDGNHRHFFYSVAAGQWFNLRCNILSAAFLAAVTAAILLGGLSAAWAGLVLNYQMQLVSRIRIAIQLRARLDMQLNSVERVMEYAAIPSEPPAIVENYRAPPVWPSDGRIVVKDLVIRYNPQGPDVLRGLSFTTAKSEKIGVVGRTGAGKSTLSLAFLRIVPIISGTIEIDGVDIGKLGLKDLRTRLTIVPQDPVLFEGTIRSNLDPLDAHTDAEIWSAVRDVGLVESLERNGVAAAAAAAVNSASGDAFTFSLEFAIEENGGNLSLGQRQLVCLARALIRRSRVIILDEASASIDYVADALIQKAIRETFKSSTVLTIAHRIRSIADYDRVLVLDSGAVVEYDTPANLMDMEGGIFARMCRQTGQAEELRALASKNK